VTGVGRLLILALGLRLPNLPYSHSSLLPLLLAEKVSLAWIVMISLILLVIDSASATLDLRMSLLHFRSKDLIVGVTKYGSLLVTVTVYATSKNSAA